MRKLSNRDKILAEGLNVVHARGFGNASVRDIVHAAGVPQGSFTNHFPNKEAFGLEIIDLYLADQRRLITDTLRNDDLSPLVRLGGFIDAAKDRMVRHSVRNGCLFGNFIAEASDNSEAIRGKLVGILGEVSASLAYCLRAAVAKQELPEGFASEDVAAFILSSLHGAILIAKGLRDPEPIDRFKRILFADVLRGRDAAMPQGAAPGLN